MIKIPLEKFPHKPQLQELYTCHVSGSKNIATLTIIKIEEDHAFMDWIFYDWIHVTSNGEVYDVIDERQ